MYGLIFQQKCRWCARNNEVETWKISSALCSVTAVFNQCTNTCIYWQFLYYAMSGLWKFFVLSFSRDSINNRKLGDTKLMNIYKLSTMHKIKVETMVETLPRQFHGLWKMNTVEIFINILFYLAWPRFNDVESKWVLGQQKFYGYLVSSWINT